MVLSESSLPFLELLKEMTIAMIPPGYDGHKLGFDDEDLVAPALRLSRIPYKRETIDYYRNDESKAACTRGEWFTEHTIFTHGFMHNWETGSHNIVPYDYLRNNIKPGMPSKTVDGIILGLEKRITSKNYWIKLGFDNSMQLDGWILDPAAGAFWHKDYTTPKFIDPR
jgi:hypothetical protein